MVLIKLHFRVHYTSNLIYMKSLSLTLVILLSLAVSSNVFSQNVAVNSSGNDPDASAMLDVSSTNSGVLLPRMTTAQQNAIALPANGLLIYNSTTNSFMVNTGTSFSPIWTPLALGTSGWSTTGNAGTSTNSNFLGTTDNKSLLFRTNNIAGMILDSAGNLGIGTVSPQRALHVARNNSGTPSILALDNSNTTNGNGISLSFRGTSTGAGGAAFDEFATIQSVYSTHDNATKASALKFYTSVAGTNAERMRISTSGYLGIANSAPTNALHVFAAANPVRFEGLQTGSGTDKIMTVDATGVVRQQSMAAVSSANSWSLTGNAGTSAATNFLGTTDNNPLTLKVNNILSGKLSTDVDGGVSFGQSSLNGGSGIQNTALGYYSLSVNTGNFNTAVGNSSQLSNTTGGVNTSTGHQSLMTNTSGNYNSAFGAGAMKLATTGTYNTAVGANAMGNPVTGSNNASLGSNSLRRLASGNNNTAVGESSLFFNVAGLNNTATGVSSLSNTTGNNNTAVGYNAGNVNTAGVNNTFIGASANASTAALTNATAVGSNAIVACDSCLVLGNAANVGIGTTTPVAALNVVKNSTGGLMVLQNTNAAGYSSADFLNNSGTLAGTFGYGNPGAGGAFAGKSYFNSYGNDFTIVNGSTSMMYYKASNNFVGIGTSSPAYKLQVLGTNPLSLLGVQLGTNTSADSLLTISGGVVKKLPASTFATSAAAISSLNGLTATTQTFATGTSGTDFNIASSGSAHTFNIPDASATARGAINNSAQTIGGNKTLTGNTTIGGTLGVTGASTLTGNTTVGGTLGVSGTITASNLGSGTATDSVVTANASGVLRKRKVSDLLTGSVDTTNIANFSTKVRSLFSSTTPITYGNGSIGITQASAATDGYLSSADWNTFNNKGGAVTSGDLTETGSSILNITGGTGAVMGTGTTIQVTQANSLQNGFLSKTDWSTFNNKVSTSRSINTTAPLQGGGSLTANRTLSIADAIADGTTKGAATFNPADFNSGSGSISIDYLNGQPATAGSNGFLSSADWTLFNNKLSTIDTTDIASFSGKVRSLFSATAPVIYNNGTIGITQAGTASNGYLSSADWNIFNSKANANSAWSLTGNTGVTGNNFLGTSDNHSLRFRTNNTQRMKIDSTGNVAIGQNTFDVDNPEKVVINAGVTGSVNALVVKGSIDNYLQFNIKNESTGSSSTSDIVATADNGTETSNYVDLGINGSNYSGSAIETGVANDAYLISAANDFYLVNSSEDKSMLFLTGGTGIANERMRILANGRVGMGVQNPTAPFVVKDTMEIRRVGSLSQLLFTNTSGTGDFRIGGDGGDIFWQGGGGRGLQMGSFWGTVLTGDRQTSAYPAFLSAPSGTGVLVLGQRNGSVPLGVQAFSASQTANLSEWRNSAGAALSAIDKSGNLGLGNSAPSQKLDVTGNIKFSGALMPNNLPGTSGYVLTSQGAGTAPIWTAPGNQTISFAPTGDVTGSTTGTSTLAPVLSIGAGKVTNSMLAGSITASKLIGTDINTVGTITTGVWNGTPITVTNGGTGLTGTSQGGIIYGSATNTLATLPKNTFGTKYLSNTGTSNNPAWAQIDLANGVSGNLSVTNLNGGTAASGTTFWRGDGTWASVKSELSAGTGIGYNNTTGVITNTGVTSINGQTGNATFPIGNLTETGSSVLTISGGGSSVIGSGTSLQVKQASTSQSGFLSSADWNTFNNKAGAASGWSITGNTGTSATTNFLGTTDAQDVVFKTNNTERLRIVNGVSASTGTAGDVTLGDATSGTVRSNKEMVMREDGDVYGPSILRLRNRNGENGAIFETIGASAALVDFLFKTGTVGSPLVSNIRFETRNSALFSTGNSMEWQIGQAASPTLVVSAATTGNSSLLRGNFGIGKAVPTQKLDVSGNINADGSIYVDGTASNTGSGTPGLILGGTSSGESISSKRTAGTNQYGIDFYTSSNNRMTINNAGNVGIGTSTPNSTLQNTGSTSMSITTQTSTYNVADNDYTILCNNTSAISVYLPTAVGISGRIYIIKRISSANVTVNADGAEKIDGALTKVLNTSYARVTVQSDGSNWFILSN